MKIVLFIVGLGILIGAEILKVYYIMPFPGSQEDNTIEIAYLIHKSIWTFRIAGLVLVSYPAFLFLKSDNAWVKWPTIIVLAFWLMVAYVFNFRFLAEKMFLQPESKRMVAIADNKVPEKQLVLGVTVNGESRAYPIEIIGYHHQVLDTVAGEPIMVTYCTVCRTGRVFLPEVDGQPETFRLVGMDHYNAMFEDARTKSWWRQVNGEAIVGPLKGKQLPELESEQMTLAAWKSNHPETKVLQPDSLFLSAYESLKDYDEGKMKGRLEGKDSVSWGDKSWVVGLQIDQQPRAYDWIELEKTRVINDAINATPVLVVIEPDSATFHAFSRIVDTDTLEFTLTNNAQGLTDTKTNSIWNWSGACQEGPLAGKKLSPLRAYQEYWHSWRTFHPQTTQYKMAK